MIQHGFTGYTAQGVWTMFFIVSLESDPLWHIINSSVEKVGNSRFFKQKIILQDTYKAILPEIEAVWIKTTIYEVRKGAFYATS